MSLQLDYSQLGKHLQLLGYTPDESVYLADFVGKPQKLFPADVKARRWTFKASQLDQLKQHQHKGLYLVVNGQAHKDAGVLSGKAVFIEHDLKDGLTKEEQKELWQSINIPEPTFQVETRNSIHQYWVFNETIDIGAWRELIEDLIACTGADPVNKNPSRVMRLAGSWHIAKNEDGTDKEPFQNLIIAESGITYAYQDLRDKISSRKEINQPVIKLEDEFAGETQPEFNENSVDLLDLLNNRILPSLSPEQQFNWSGHSFKYRNSTKIEGNCPWHESTSGTSFYADHKDGQWIWRCCSCDIGGTAVNYRHRLSGGDGSPRGKDFVEVVRELATEAGVEMPVFKATGNRQQATAKKVVSGEERNEYYDIPEPRYGELGLWQYKKRPKTVLDPATGEKTYERNADGQVIFETKKEFKVKTDFDFEVVDYLMDEENGGAFVLQLKQIHNKSKRILIRSNETNSLKEFKNALNKAYGCRLTCTLTLEQLDELLQYKKDQYYLAGGKTHHLASVRGQQPNGYWVFEDIQFTPEGEVCTSEESGIVFSPNYSDGDAVPSPKILPPNKEILGKLLKVVKEYTGETAFMPTFFTIASQVMGVHYQAIYAKNNRFPLTNITGDPGSGKSFATEIAQSLIGLRAGKGSVSSSSKSSMYEWLKRSSGITLVIDDPIKSPVLDEILKNVYDAKQRAVRGNTQQPHSSLLIASNHPIGESSAAILSRMIFIPFFVAKGINKDKNPELQQLLPLASGAFSDFIKFGYDEKAIGDLAQEFFKTLPNTVYRVAESLAHITYYALKLAPFAGLTETEVKDYVINTLCKSADQSNSSKDSLTDFLDKLDILKTKNYVGEWDYCIKEKVGNDGTVKRYAAFILDSVWPILMKEFNVAYGKGTIRDLLIKRGGVIGKTQRFIKSRDVYKAWDTQRLSKTADLHPPETISKRCCLVPIVKEPEPANDEQVLDEMEASSNIDVDTNSDNASIVVEYSVVEEKESEPTQAIEVKVEPVAIEPVVVAPVKDEQKEADKRILIKHIASELEKVTDSDAFTDCSLKYRTPENDAIFTKAWYQLPSYVQVRIIALQKGVIDHIKKFPMCFIPQWCQFTPGELVVYKDKLHWVTGVPSDCDLLLKDKGKHMVSIKLVKGSPYEINVEIEDIKSWQNS